MENKNTAKRETRYVFTNDGIKMTYEEWLDMVRSERN